MATFYALIVSIVIYRAMNVATLYQIFVESARSAASVGLVIGASLILTYVVIQENIPQMISELFEGSAISPLAFLLLVALWFVAWLHFGRNCYYTSDHSAFHTCNTWYRSPSFGVLIVVNSMIGLITPPYGMLLFVINAVTGIQLKEIIRVWPFLGILIAALLVMTLVPEIVLWLPRYFGYQG